MWFLKFTHINTFSCQTDQLNYTEILCTMHERHRSITKAASLSWINQNTFFFKRPTCSSPLQLKVNAFHCCKSDSYLLLLLRPSLGWVWHPLSLYCTQRQWVVRREEEELLCEQEREAVKAEWKLDERGRKGAGEGDLSLTVLQNANLKKRYMNCNSSPPPLFF